MPLEIVTFKVYRFLTEIAMIFEHTVDIYVLLKQNVQLSQLWLAAVWSALCQESPEEPRGLGSGSGRDFDNCVAPLSYFSPATETYCQ